MEMCVGAVSKVWFVQFWRVDTRPLSSAKESMESGRPRHNEARASTRTYCFPGIQKPVRFQTSITRLWGCRDSQVFCLGAFQSACPLWLGTKGLQWCRKIEDFRPQVWWGDNCARQDKTNPGERGYSMAGGNWFTNAFSSFQGLLAMLQALMPAKPFDQR